MAGHVFFCPQCGGYLPESVVSCACGFVIPIAEPEEHEGRALRERGATFPPAPPDLSAEPTPSPKTKLLAQKTSARLLAGLLVLFAIIAAVLFFKQHEGSRSSKPGEETASIVGASDKKSDPAVLPGTPPASTAAASFNGKWQLVEGELHPITKEVVKSFLTIAGTPDTPTVVWTSELDGSVGHTISLKYTSGSLSGDYYGSKGNVVIEMLGDGRLSFTINPYAEFAPIKKSIYARVLDTASSKELRTDAGEAHANMNAVAQDLVGVWRGQDGNCLDIDSGASGDLYAGFRQCVAGAHFLSVGLHLVGPSLRYNGDNREQLTVMSDGSLKGALESIPLRERVGPTGLLRFYKDSPPEYLKPFIGTWETNDTGGLLEISYTNNRLRIRDCPGPHATSGVEYFARYSNGEIIATGDPHDFYKFQFPSFEILSNGTLHIDCGACVDAGGLKKSAQAMPSGVKYMPPVNGD